MKKNSSPNVTPEDTQEAQALALDTATILKLIDLLYMGRDNLDEPLS